MNKKFADMVTRTKKRKDALRKQKANTRLLAVAKTDGRCWYCGSPAKTLDHIVPRSLGGKDNLDNLVPCCKPCNSMKITKSVEEFRELMRKKDGTLFSDAQIKYLASIGVQLPPSPSHVFWFESNRH